MKQIYPLVFIVFLFALLSMKHESSTTKIQQNLVVLTADSYPPKITLSPNPATDILFIHTPVGYKSSKIEVYNIFGALKKTTPSSTRTLNVKSLPTGIYYLKIYTDTKTITKRFIKS